MPDPERQIVVEVDAFYVDTGLSQGLSQSAAADQKLHPCAFSRRLTLADKNYDIGKRELLAVGRSCRFWYGYHPYHRPDTILPPSRLVATHHIQV